MNRSLPAAALALALLAAGVAGCAPQAKLLVVKPAETPIDGLTRLAILDFAGEGESGRIARAAVLNQFWNNKHYTLVDPAELARIRPLHGPDGKLDPALALEAARQASVDALLTGQVVNYSVRDDSALDQHLEVLGADEANKSETSGGGALGLTFNSNHTLMRQATVAVAVQLIDVPTGEVRAARQFTHTFDGKVVNGKGTLPASDAVLTKLLNECASDAVAMLAPHRETLEVTLAQQYYGKGMAALAQGNTLATEGKWDEAQAIWQGIVRENHKNHAALYNLALAAERAQDYPAALRQIDAAIQHYPAKLYNQTRVRMKQQQRDYLAAASQIAARRTVANLAVAPAVPPTPAATPAPAATVVHPPGPIHPSAPPTPPTVQQAGFAEALPQRLPAPAEHRP